MATDFILAYRSSLSEPTTPVDAVDRAARKLELTVLFTGLPFTLQALEKANVLARDLHARIRLVVPQVVPYPLSLESPPVLVEFNEHRFRALAADQPIETRVEIFLCRDMHELLAEILPNRSTVVTGGRKRWWPTQEERLARRLCRQGHEAILVVEPLRGETHIHA
jgi:hypothetical protein